jgi:hypothetical protein
MLPAYRIPPVLLICMALDLLQGKPRSFGQDDRTCTGAVSPPICYIGLDALPPPPCIITINHFTRPGFQAWWLALGVSAALTEEVRWLVTAAWTFPGRSWAKVGEWASRRLLQRLAQMYGFGSMPPMPPRPQETLARAQAVRRLMQAVRAHQPGWIGIAPEGRDAPGGVLHTPPQGSGRFLLLMANRGLPILPVGIYEGSGALTIRFGAAYTLQVAPGLSSQARDREASRIVMLQLAELLPAHLRGEYRQ